MTDNADLIICQVEESAGMLAFSYAGNNWSLSRAQSLSNFMCFLYDGQMSMMPRIAIVEDNEGVMSVKAARHPDCVVMRK